MSVQEELEQLITEGKELLRHAGAFGRKELALQDMIDYAERACKGELFPFTGKREFCAMGKAEQMKFALSHYTMVPSFQIPGCGYGTYGLREAIDWYKNQAGEAAPKAGGVRLHIRENVGNYKLFSDDEARNIKEKVANVPYFQELYRKVKRKSDQATLEERIRWYEANFARDTYGRLSEEIDFWRANGNGSSFLVPEETRTARFSMELPCGENEESGLGHIEIRNIVLQCESGKRMVLSENKEIYLCNQTDADHAVWEWDGKLELEALKRYTLSMQVKQEGKFHSGLRIQILFLNERGEAFSEYLYTYNKKSWIPVKDYNLSMQCSAFVYFISGDLNYARKAKYEMLHEMDDLAQGCYYWMAYNERPEGDDSYGAVQIGRNLASLAMTWDMIRDANVFETDEYRRFYDLTEFLLHNVLDMRDRTEMSFEEAQRGATNWQTDMCVGASLMLFALENFPNREVWLDNAYAVLYGQLTCNLNDDGSWPESIRYHFAVLERFACYARILKYRTNVDWFQETRLLDMFSFGIDIQTPPSAFFDDCVSTPPFGDHKLGGGEEFGLYGLYINVVRHYNEDLAGRMLDTWRASGCKEKRIWGESLLVENFMTAVPFAGQGRSRQIVGGHVSADTDCRISSDEKDTPLNMLLPPYVHNPDAGIHIFRQVCSNGTQNYLAVMSSRNKIGHGHCDQGSFLIYKQNVPIVMDGGIEGYFDATTAWHISSWSHACMLFAAEPLKNSGQKEIFNLSAGNYTREKGYLDTPLCSRVIAYEHDGRMDTITIEIRQQGEKGRHIRKIVFDRLEESWEILDETVEYGGNLIFILPLLARSFKMSKDTAHIEGYYGVEADIRICSQYESIDMERGRATKMCPTPGNISYLTYLRICAKAEQGFRIKIR